MECTQQGFIQQCVYRRVLLDSPNKAAPASFAQNSAEVHASAIVAVVIDTIRRNGIGGVGGGAS